MDDVIAASKVVQNKYVKVTTNSGSMSLVIRIFYVAISR
jgi:hypothetical protein